MTSQDLRQLMTVGFFPVGCGQGWGLGANPRPQARLATRPYFCGGYPGGVDSVVVAGASIASRPVAAFSRLRGHVAPSQSLAAIIRQVLLDQRPHVGERFQLHDRGYGERLRQSPGPVVTGTLGHGAMMCAAAPQEKSLDCRAVAEAQVAVARRAPMGTGAQAKSGRFSAAGKGATLSRLGRRRCRLSAVSRRSSHRLDAISRHL